MFSATNATSSPSVVSGRMLQVCTGGLASGAGEDVVAGGLGRFAMVEGVLRRREKVERIEARAPVTSP
jgi:hypothetical protein